MNQKKGGFAGKLLIKKWKPGFYTVSRKVLELWNCRFFLAAEVLDRMADAARRKKSHPRRGDQWQANLPSEWASGCHIRKRLAVVASTIPSAEAVPPSVEISAQRSTVLMLGSTAMRTRVSMRPLT